MDKLAVVGIGYVGLVSAACLAEVGYHVACVDIDVGKVAQLQNGIVPLYEPSLEEFVQRNYAAGRLSFTTRYEEALSGAKVAILAVDTPTREDGQCDLKNIESAARSIGNTVSGDLVTVVKSTVPVGTSQHISHLIDGCLRSRAVSYRVEVVSNPEFLREGAAVGDFMHPERIILGVSSEVAEEIMRDLYRPFGHTPDTFIVMDTASSELSKYAANTMLACRISYMNWLSRLCECTGADIGLVRQGIGSDSRIGPAFLNAGVGFGGSCFPKDVKALRGMAREFGLRSPLIDAIESTNVEQKRRLGDKMVEYFSTRGGIEGKVIGILGLSFKPDTDDMREAPSLVLIRQLLEVGASVRVFDPVACHNAKKLLAGAPISWCGSEYDVAAGADGLALVTEWDVFRRMDLVKTLSMMRGRAFFDGRNVFFPDEMGAIGFDYISVGRQPVLNVPSETCV